MKLIKLFLGLSLISGSLPAFGKVDSNISRQIVPQVLGRSPEELRPWRAPQFENQKKALGYSAKTFSIPKGMEAQVSFWKDVYTKYDSKQGVIHDSEDFSKVYRVVNLRGLNTEKQRQKRIDDVKLEISKSLKNPLHIKRLRFQLGQRDRMLEGIFYSGRYLEKMEKIFKQAGLPIELTRLVFVESSFNIMARSKVGASGIWQIMPYTAKPHRMISAEVDKRNHPLEATRFAAQLLKDNYKMLQSWPLAVTGYNHGPTGVRKMTLKYQTRDLSELVQNVKSRASFGFASRNFYASFLAALEVERNAEKYFGNQVVWSRPLASNDLKLPRSIAYKDLLNWFDGDDRRAQLYNPHLTVVARKGQRAIPAKTTIAIPQEKYNFALIALARKDQTVAMETTTK